MTIPFDKVQDHVAERLQDTLEDIEDIHALVILYKRKDGSLVSRFTAAPRDFFELRTKLEIDFFDYLMAYKYQCDDSDTESYITDLCGIDQRSSNLVPLRKRDEE